MNLAIKSNRAVSSLKSNLPIQFLLKIFDTMIVPILICGADIWGPSGKYNFFNWEKTEENPHLSAKTNFRTKQIYIKLYGRSRIKKTSLNHGHAR